MKTFAKVLAGLLVLAALAWTGMFLYWHVTILGALRTLETQTYASGQESEALVTLRDGAGCRALPYLVAALEVRKSPYFLDRVSYLISFRVMPPHEGIAGHELKEWYLFSVDSVDERKRKIEVIRNYWRQHGSRHHQFWRVWSKACVPEAGG